MPGPEAWFMTTEDRITQLEDQIHELHDQQADLRRKLAKAQLDQWQGRIQDLQVQMHLGAMEASDKATAQMKKLLDRWADARRQLEESVKTASSVADTVRTGLEKAFDDVRQALLESKNKLTSSSSR
jgi:chromosome segregation ATPase